jgi:hypothetical protein
MSFEDHVFSSASRNTFKGNRYASKAKSEWLIIKENQLIR